MGSPQRALKREHNKAAARWLQSFPPFQSMQPLVIGVHKALRHIKPPDIKKSALCRVMRGIVRSRRYLTALSEPGAMRHDLDGKPVYPVSLEHQQIAKGKLDAMV